MMQSVLCSIGNNLIGYTSNIEIKCPFSIVERKLFVGMVSKKYDEDDVKKMFTSFGTIEECSVLRDNNGISKGTKAIRIC